MRLITTATAIAVSGLPTNSDARREQQIGAEHGDLAMRHVQHPAHAIDQHIAAGEQRIDRRQHDDIDDELHGLTLSRSFRGAGEVREPGLHKLRLRGSGSRVPVPNAGPGMSGTARRSLHVIRHPVLGHARWPTSPDPSGRPDSTGGCGNGCPCSTRSVRRAGPGYRPSRVSIAARILAASAGQPAFLSAASSTMPPIQPSVSCSAG